MKRSVLFVGIGRTSSGLRILPLARYRKLQELKGWAATYCGGYSLSFVTGGWINPLTHELVEEKVARFELYSDCAPADLERLAAVARDLFRQECVLLDLGGEEPGRFV